MNEGIMQQVSLDADKSRELYMEHPQHYGIRQCYTNVYRVITENFSKAAAREWKVAYGYYAMSNHPNLLMRHCFILDEENHVIDPTIFTHKNVDLNHIYYTMYVFPSVSADLEAVKAEDYFPGLTKYLQSCDRDAYAWAEKNDCYLCG